jgi:plastocyanin
VKRLPLTLVVAVALPLALVACGGENQAAETGAAAQTLAVTATDFRFDPAELRADGGEVAVALTNDGGAPHALAIRGHGVDESSDVIDGGDSTEFTVSLEDGTYEIYCPVGDHEEQGMVGTLTVGSGGGATTHEDDSTTEDTETEDDTGGADTGKTETGETDTDDSGGSGSDDATNY